MNPKKNVMDAKEYMPPLENRKGMIRLDFNENTRGCSPRVAEALRRASTEDISCYPSYDEFRKRLSRKINVKDVLLTNGSDEAIKLVIETYVEKGDKVVMAVPTFAMFAKDLRMAQADITEIPYKDGMAFPLEGYLDEAEDARMIIIVNPNNPTGTGASKKEIKKIVERTNGIVVVDEAYYPFCSETMIDEVENYDNLIVLRTFSKSYGLAGLRIGYIAAKELKWLRITHHPYTVNQLAVIAAGAALEDEEYIERYAESVKVEKKRLEDFLDRNSIRYFKSIANFILVDFDRDDVDKLLEESGILVRKIMADRPLFRITIGTKEETDKLIEALEEII